jgi:hypothetical protein
MRGIALNLIGVDYQRQRAAEGKKAPMLAGLEPLVRRDVPNILLSHNPNSFPRAAELGIELSLAGHTHGGQVRVEILDHRWSPAQFLTPYVAGLYRRPLRTSAHVPDVQVANSPFPPSFLTRPVRFNACRCSHAASRVLLHTVWVLVGQALLSVRFDFATANLDRQECLSYPAK